MPGPECTKQPAHGVRLFDQFIVTAGWALRRARAQPGQPPRNGHVVLRPCHCRCRPRAWLVGEQAGSAHAETQFLIVKVASLRVCADLSSLPRG